MPGRRGGGSGASRRKRETTLNKGIFLTLLYMVTMGSDIKLTFGKEQDNRQTQSVRLMDPRKNSSWLLSLGAGDNMGSLIRLFLSTRVPGGVLSAG